MPKRTRRRRSAPPSRTVLVVALGVGVLVLLGMGGWTVQAMFRQRDSSVAARRADRLATAQALSAQLRPWFDGAAHDARALAAQLTVSGAQTRLPQLAASAGHLEAGAFVVDGSGLVIATTPSRAGLLRLVRRDGVIGAALVGRAGFSGVTTDPLVGSRPVVRVAVPLGSGAAPAGALVAESDARSGSVSSALLPAANAGVVRLVLVAPDGRVVDRAGTTVAATLDVSRALQSARGRGGLVFYQGEGGLDRLAGVAPVRGGWVVLSEGRADAIRPGSRGALVQAAVGVVALTLAAVAVLLAAARQLRRQRLAAEHQRLAMLTVTGHELRTPLTVILGSIPILTRRWASLPDDRRQELLTGVGAQARTLDRLVERLLHAGRLAAGQERGLALQPVDVGAIAQEVADDVTSPIHQVRVGQRRAPNAVADRAAIRQVLGHLVDNAVKYSPDGGPIDVTVEGGGGALRPRVVVTVSDQGVGLPADFSRIFDRFVQVEATDTRLHDEGGIGLGLAIARDLVDEMGGTLRAERNQPAGARFVVKLPVADPSAD